MFNFIEQFYYGNIEPQECSSELTAEMKKKLSQLTKKEAKDWEKCSYGSMTLKSFESEDEYNQAIEKAKEEGKSVR